MKKTLVILVGGLLILLIGSFYFFNKQKDNQPQEQTVLKQTFEISKKYTVLRYQTDNVLLNIENFTDYDAWNNEMSNVIQQWKTLESETVILEESVAKMAEEKASFNLISQSLAYDYDTKEVLNIINKAPLKKQIRTLANHLGVDAKTAQLILNETQNQISREAYAEEGDFYETCEQSSMRIKNGAKVTIFVGGIALTGGMSAVATGGTLAQTSLVVGGADLVLEIADDEAKIALGDKNKVSEMVGTLRVATEPAAGILTIASMPGNLSKSMEKVSAAYFGADQVRSAVQDKKILGISIKINENAETEASLAGLTEQELPEWMKENNVVKSGESVEEILNQVEKEIKEEARRDVKEENKEEKQNQVEEKKGTSASKSKLEDIPAQIFKVVNVSDSPYMIDACFSSTCWDDLAANPAEDIEVGGIYTMGKVFDNGEGFEKGFHPIDFKNSNQGEISENNYKITVYFAIAPFEGPKNYTVDYGTWENHSIEISANYGDETIIEWDGSSLRQIK
jgi:hypothetical protein